MTSIISHNYPSYASQNYYSIKKTANQNWNNFKILLELQSVLQDRKTPYAKNLKRRIEVKLKWLVEINRNEPRILQNMRDQLLLEDSDFADILYVEVNDRLEELESECFPFPKTEIFGICKLKIVNRQKKGLLLAVGYETGQKALDKGIDKKLRQARLDDLYTAEIPRNTEVKDIKRWGDPETSTRLCAIVYEIAHLTKQEKGNTWGDYRISISDREADLKYLKKKYYDNSRYDWKYPKT